MRYLKLLRLPITALVFAFPAMLMSLIVSLIRAETTQYIAFIVPLGIIVILIIPVGISLKRSPPVLQTRDGFFVVTMTWLIFTVWGALPYLLAGQNLSITGAMFESANGFTSTGGSVINNLEALPHSLLLWRATSYWIGGMGIILLTVALLPLLGVGGFQLIKAEANGPEKDRITPKITATAKTLWFIYCAITIIAFILYTAGGMPLFDALCHALTTAATGGVSIKNSGIAHYNSAYLEIVYAGTMFFSAINFNLYYRLLQKKFSDVYYNSELRGYLALFLVAAFLIIINIHPLYDSWHTAAREGIFQTAAFLSTGGAAITDYTAWPPLAQCVLLFLMAAGGCSGSTAGGIKIIRYIVLFKQAGNEMRRLVYPRGVFSVQLNHKVGRKDVVYGVAGFIFIYILSIIILTLLTAHAGFDSLSSFSTALGIMGNLGTGFGALAPGNNFSIFPDYLKWIYIVFMIAGRLELWTVLILFNRDYWRN